MKYVYYCRAFFLDHGHEYLHASVSLVLFFGKIRRWL